MTVAARGRALSVRVHAVDDAGALCGARPSPNWKLSTRFPVNCPRCLLTLSRPRYSTCETVTAGPVSPIHIRLVGPEGVCKGGTAAKAWTLCGLPVGWDLGLVRPQDLTYQRACRLCRSEYTKANGVR